MTIKSEMGLWSLASILGIIIAVALLCAVLLMGMLTVAVGVVSVVLSYPEWSIWTIVFVIYACMVGAILRHLN
jgi:hypothetical protein